MNQPHHALHDRTAKLPPLSYKIFETHVNESEDTCTILASA